ncbi:hypothetical protein IP91_02304 [Pseudoduganella lurida]|uniref:Uncharacterized protein n=1 Tax=Pseudoduganella lurida TaxID=1036180 RepID=A0A562RBQ7_9BURK|nr:hypothetical protein [Pseudoduganella lurida]TWI66487.1 hypothetical protein IP91_02304 [Pseudoduganella lurida]
MTTQGPPLAMLTRRLAETPGEFLDTPHVAAVANDVALLLGARLPPPVLKRMANLGSGQRRPLVALLAWMLADDWFVATPPGQPALVALFEEGAAELAATASARRFIGDPERREELVRVALARLGWHPADETHSQATDRLAAISGIERRRLLEASRAAERRARELREALARQAAEEAADKWSRE